MTYHTYMESIVPIPYSNMEQSTPTRGGIQSDIVHVCQIKMEAAEEFFTPLCLPARHVHLYLNTFSCGVMLSIDRRACHNCRGRVTVTQC